MCMIKITYTYTHTHMHRVGFRKNVIYSLLAAAPPSAVDRPGRVRYLYRHGAVSPHAAERVPSTPPPYRWVGKRPPPQYERNNRIAVDVVCFGMGRGRVLTTVVSTFPPPPPPRARLWTPRFHYCHTAPKRSRRPRLSVIIVTAGPRRILVGQLAAGVIP